MKFVCQKIKDETYLYVCATVCIQAGQDITESWERFMLTALCSKILGEDEDEFEW